MGKYRNRYGRDRSARVQGRDVFSEIDGDTDKSGSSRRSHYKDAQIVKIAARVLDQEVGSWERSIVWGLSVVHVECVARGTHLVVIVASSHADVDAREVAAWLDTHVGAMRSALARVLARKRVPGLSVQYAGVRGAAEHDAGEETGGFE